MTTSRTPFAPFLATLPRLLPIALGIGTVGTGLPATGWTAPQAEGVETGIEISRVIRLPAWEAARYDGAAPRLEGRHLFWSPDDLEDAAKTLGPVVPERALVAMIERQIDQVGGRDSGVSVESLGSTLLLRGGSAAPGGPVDSARRAALATIGAMAGVTEALTFQTRVRLLRTGDGEGPESAAVFDETRMIASGSRASFGAQAARTFVADFDVEVATGISIGDASTAVALSGETLHLWASSNLDDAGRRRLYVQGLLDLGIDSPGEPFDPDVYELGAVEQPVIRTVQVFFAGTVPEREPLVVEISDPRLGDPADGSGSPSQLNRRLEISATSLAEASGQDGSAAPPLVDEARLIDLARGMWRAELGTAHVLTGNRLPFELTASRTPATAAQLLGLAFGRSGAKRPDLGTTLAILPAGVTDAYARTQALFRELDPPGPNHTLVIEGADGLRVRLPAARGALLRVAQTHETNLITDYDPQIANDSALADPRTEFLMTGTALEAHLTVDTAGTRLHGTVHARRLTELTVRESDPMDGGKIQLPTLEESSGPLELRGFGSTDVAGWKVSLER
ncbi:MAG: hypothetical protein AAGG01_05700 [Planctomycetota bacterium]